MGAASRPISSGVPPTRSGRRRYLAPVAVVVVVAAVILAGLWVAGVLPHLLAGGSNAYGPTEPPRYLVTFHEGGHSPGTIWSVTLNGSINSSVGTTIAFREPNGSYPFTVGTVANFTQNVTSGTVRVEGAALAESVEFVAHPQPTEVSETGSQIL
jgi:hypothetical protein